MQHVLIPYINYAEEMMFHQGENWGILMIFMQQALMPGIKYFKESVVLPSLTLGNNYNINATIIDAACKIF